MEQLFFAGKANLKINSLVKTPLHEILAVERSGLWAPDRIYCSCQEKIYDIEYPGKGWEFSNLIANGNMTGVSRGFKAFPDP